MAMLPRRSPHVHADSRRFAISDLIAFDPDAWDGFAAGLDRMSHAPTELEEGRERAFMAALAEGWRYADECDEGEFVDELDWERGAERRA